MNRKAQKFSLKFLINLILALVVFIPAIMFAGKFFRLSGDSLDSFYTLANTMNELTNSDIKELSQEVVLKLDQETLVVGFKKGNFSFRHIKSGLPGYGDYFADFLYILKPEECSDDSCICLFQDFKVDALKDQISSLSLSQQQKLENTENLYNWQQVVALNMNRLGGSEMDFLTIDYLENKWRFKFLLSGGKKYCIPINSEIINREDILDVEEIAGGKIYTGTFERAGLFERRWAGVTNSGVEMNDHDTSRIRVLTIQKYGDFVTVCSHEDKDCIPEEIKKAVDKFDSFKEVYDICSKEINGCICSEFDISTFDDAGIYITKQGEENKLILQDNSDTVVGNIMADGESMISMEKEINKNPCYYDLETGVVVDDISEIQLSMVVGNYQSTEPYLFSSFNQQIFFFTNDWSNTCLLKKNSEEIYKYDSKGVWKLDEDNYSMLKCGETVDKLTVIFVPVNSNIAEEEFTQNANNSWEAIKKAFDYGWSCSKPLLLTRRDVFTEWGIETKDAITEEGLTLQCYYEPDDTEDFPYSLDQEIQSIEGDDFLIIGIDNESFTVEYEDYNQKCEEFSIYKGFFNSDRSLFVISSLDINSVFQSSFFKNNIINSKFSDFTC